MTNNAQITIVEAQWILTGNASDEPLLNHSLVFENGRVLDVLPHEYARSTYTSAEIIDRKTHILMPGMVNAHGHAAMSLFRGVANDMELGDWLVNRIWPLEKRWVSEEMVALGTELAIAEMVATGTTAFSDMYFYGDAAATVAHDAGMRTQVCFTLIDAPTPGAPTAQDALDAGLKLADKWQHSDLIQIAFGPHAPYTVGDDTFSKMIAISNEIGIPTQIHLHETQKEVDDSIKQYGERPMERLKRLGLLAPNLQAVHLCALNDADIQMMADHGVGAVHCPKSNLKLNSGLSPVQKMINAGMSVSLGTDGAASNNNLCMFDEMKTAALIGKVAADDSKAVDAKQAIQMATLDGARVMGIDKETGSLNKGKFADFITIDTQDICQQPLYNPEAHLVYQTSGHRVTDTYVQGKPLFSNGKHTSIDVDRIYRDVERFAERLMATE